MNTESNLSLLRRFEPVIRYTRGEQFFPTCIEDYLAECSLWVQRPGESPECLLPEGEVTLEKIAEPRSNGFRAVEYLQFIEPLNITELANYRMQQLRKKKDTQDIFRAGRGRLARVGYGSRFVDALFSISLLARGRITGDTSAAAALTYQRMRKKHEHYCYYGRVIHQSGWFILQYWFLYPFNNWRSGFFGVNDHEADWEMITIYLYKPTDGQLKPEWVAYANHDFTGDSLRRRWDDHEIEKVGEHPVVFAGAGSHASYFSSGEYLTELELPFLSPFVHLVDWGQSMWRKLLKKTGGTSNSQNNSQAFNLFRIPFVDYARGDGISIGEEQAKPWDEAILIDPPPPWVMKYRGLWGYFARDPISGENAPAGVRYNRDGSIRQAWYDPLGWAGLDKVPPPDRVISITNDRRAEINAERETIRQSILEKQNRLYIMGTEACAMRDRPHLKNAYQDYKKKIDALSRELRELRSHLSEDESMLDALDLYASRLQKGEREPARAHIQRAQYPGTVTGLRISRIAETWAAISIGLIMIGFVVLVFFARQYLIFGLAVMFSLIVFIESGFRRQLPHLITSVTIGLAIVSALVLLFEFFWPMVIIVVLLAGGYMMSENLRELWT